MLLLLPLTLLALQGEWLFVDLWLHQDSWFSLFYWSWPQEQGQHANFGLLTNTSSGFLGLFLMRDLQRGCRNIIVGIIRL